MRGPTRGRRRRTAGTVDLLGCSARIKPPRDACQSQPVRSIRRAPLLIGSVRADRADRAGKHSLRVAAAARTRHPRGADAAIGRGHLHRRGDRALRPRARPEGRRPGRDQRRLEDGASQLRHRRCLSRARGAGRARRDPCHRVSRGSVGACRRGGGGRGGGPLAVARRGCPRAPAASDLPAAASRSHRQDAGAARPLPRPPLHSLRGGADHAGLPVPMRILQRLHRKRHHHALPAGRQCAVGARRRSAS